MNNSLTLFSNNLSYHVKSASVFNDVCTTLNIYPSIPTVIWP